jgi:hypothetical protein
MLAWRYDGIRSSSEGTALSRTWKVTGQPHLPAALTLKDVPATNWTEGCLGKAACLDILYVRRLFPQIETRFLDRHLGRLVTNHLCYSGCNHRLTETEIGLLCLNFFGIWSCVLWHTNTTFRKNALPTFVGTKDIYKTTRHYISVKSNLKTHPPEYLISQWDNRFYIRIPLQSYLHQWLALCSLEVTKEEFDNTSSRQHFGTQD